MKWSPHAGSHFSQTFHGIATLDYQLVDLHTLLIYHLLILIWWIFLPAMTWERYLKDRLRNETKNFLISKLWLVYTVTPSNSTHYYLTSSKLPINTDTAKEFPQEMKATERFRISPSLNKSLFGNFMGFYQQTRIFMYELMPFMWLATSRQLCFLWRNFVKSRAHWKQRKNFDHGMSFFKEGECRSILAKPADKSCWRKEPSRTLKGNDGLLVEHNKLHISHLS